mmetsp:Transcript_12551/g.33690  ORF Transcript_12551/g.33690 Transcript_12551/m.33690 type:complete len:221 (-) Transcript_12551:11-673(-)
MQRLVLRTQNGTPLRQVASFERVIVLLFSPRCSRGSNGHHWRQLHRRVWIRLLRLWRVRLARRWLRHVVGRIVWHLVRNVPGGRRRWMWNRSWLRNDNFSRRKLVDQFPVLGEQSPEYVAFVPVALPCQRLDVQFGAIGRREHLHSHGHASGDTLPAVVEHATAERHEEDLAAAIHRPARGHLQHAIVLRDKQSLRDFRLELCVRWRGRGKVEVGLDGHR